MTLAFDMLQTLGLSVLAFLVGIQVKSKVKIFQTYFIPAPVIGGLVFSLLIFFLHQGHLLEVKLDNSLQDFFMNLFFTCIGFTCSMAVLKKSGRLGAFLAASIVATLLVQDLIGVSLASLLGLNPLLGLPMGSISMSGGLGSALSFGPILEEAGAVGATAIGAASATFGLVLGSLVGGPVANRLIRKNHLQSEGEKKLPGLFKEPETKVFTEKTIFSSVFLVLIAAFLGTYLGKILNLTGLKFPYYVGCQFSGAILRNLLDAAKEKGFLTEGSRNLSGSLKGPEGINPTRTLYFDFDMDGIDLLGKISLNLFLSMAIMNLNIKQLFNLALPMVALLLAQTIAMMAWAYWVDFNLLGKNYDAAVMAAGHCGVGLGQTPNAIANMATIIENHGPAPVAWFLLPVVMAIAINLMNPVIITVFIRILQ